MTTHAPLVPAACRWADLGDVVLRYRREGTGDPVVLVHEMGGSLDSWDDLAGELAPAHTVIRYDQRSAGASEHVPGEITVALLARDLERLLDTLGIAGPVHLVGAAFGAATVVRFAAQAPERVASVALLAPALEVRGEARTLLLERAERAAAAGMRAVAEPTLDRAWPQGRRGEAFDRYRRRYLASDARGYAQHNRALAMADPDEFPSRLTAEVLVVAGSHDRARPADEVAATARRFGHARYTTVNAAHFMAAECPRTVAAELLPFLAEHRIRPAMQRHRDVAEGDLTAEQRDAVRAALTGPRGRVPAPMRAWLRSPEIALRAQALGSAVRYGTTLDPRLRELAILRVARHWRSHHEWRAHEAEAVAAGLDGSVIEAVRTGRTPIPVDERMEQVLAVTGRLLREGRLDDGGFEGAQRVLGERALTELVAIVGYYALVSFTLNVYRIGEGPDPFADPLPGETGAGRAADPAGEEDASDGR